MNNKPPRVEITFTVTREYYEVNVRQWSQLSLDAAPFWLTKGEHEAMKAWVAENPETVELREVASPYDIYLGTFGDASYAELRISGTLHRALGDTPEEALKNLLDTKVPKQ